MLNLLPVYWRNLQRLRRMAHQPLLQEGVIYQCPLNFRKRHNLALQQINKPLLAMRELSLPHILHVGVTTACNLRCPACPTGTKALGRPPRHLDYDLYTRILDDLRGVLLLMLFWDWGEPFLHPRLADMIHSARKSYIRTVISTNGGVNNRPKEIEKLVLAQPDMVIVCVDGLTQAVYEKYRVGGRLEEVLCTVQRLVEAREKLGTGYPVIEFRSLATRYNQPQMPGLMELACTLGADIFSVKSLRPYDFRGHDIEAEMVPLDPGLARYAEPGTWNRQPRQKPPLACGKPLYAPTLNSDGQLAFCSYAGYEEENFGSPGNTTYRHLWRDAANRSKRLEFLANGGTRSCADCFFRSEHKPTILYMVPLRPLPEGLAPVYAQTPEQFLAAWSVRDQRLEPRE